MNIQYLCKILFTYQTQGKHICPFFFMFLSLAFSIYAKYWILFTYQIQGKLILMYLSSASSIYAPPAFPGLSPWPLSWRSWGSTAPAWGQWGGQFIKFIKFTALEEREFVKFSDIPEWRSKTEVSSTHSSRLKLVAGILEAKREKKLLRQSLWKEEGH